MGTWVIAAIVLIVIGLAVYSIAKDRKNGKTCGSCNACAKRGGNTPSCGVSSEDRF